MYVLKFLLILSLLIIGARSFADNPCARFDEMADALATATELAPSGLKPIVEKMETHLARELSFSYLGPLNKYRLEEFNAYVDGVKKVATKLSELRKVYDSPKYSHLLPHFEKGQELWLNGFGKFLWKKDVNLKRLEDTLEQAKLTITDVEKLAEGIRKKGITVRDLSEGTKSIHPEGWFSKRGARKLDGLDVPENPTTSIRDGLFKQPSEYAAVHALEHPGKPIPNRLLTYTGRYNQEIPGGKPPYYEFDVGVNPTLTRKESLPRRAIVDANGDIWVTFDHHKTFQKALNIYNH